MSAENPMKQLLEQFFARLVTVQGLLFFLQSQLVEARKRLEESFQTPGIPNDMLISGSRIAFRDLTEWPADGWARYYPTQAFVTKAGERLQVLDQVFSRNAAWTISLSYEAFESFLKDICAFALENYVDKFPTNKIDPIRKKFQGNNEMTWRDAISKENNKNLFTLVRYVAPNLCLSEKENNRELDMTEWFVIATEIRHAITHSDFKIKILRIKNWPKARKVLLAKHFSGEWVEDGYELRATWDQAKCSSTLFAEYGYAIVKAISEHIQLEWKLYDYQQ